MKCCPSLDTVNAIEATRYLIIKSRFKSCQEQHQPITIQQILVEAVAFKMNQQTVLEAKHRSHIAYP